MKVSGCRILIHVYIVLVDRFHDELVALFLHGSGDKGVGYEVSTNWVELTRH